MATPKRRGYKEGVLQQEIRSMGGTILRKGQVVRYRIYKSNYWGIADREYHVLDENNSNLIRTLRLFIEGQELPDLIKEFENKKNGGKHKN